MAQQHDAELQPEAHAGGDFDRAQHAGGRDAEREIGQHQPQDQPDAETQPQRAQVFPVILRSGGRLDLRAEILFLDLHGLAAVRRAHAAQTDQQSAHESDQILPEARESAGIGGLRLVFVVHRVGGGRDLTVFAPLGGVGLRRLDPGGGGGFAFALPARAQRAEALFPGGCTLFFGLGGDGLRRLVKFRCRLGRLLGIGRRLLRGSRPILRRGERRGGCGSFRLGNRRSLRLLGKRGGEETARLVLHRSPAARRLCGLGRFLGRCRLDGCRGRCIPVELRQNVLHREMPAHRRDRRLRTAITQRADSGGKRVLPAVRHGGARIRLFLHWRHRRSHFRSRRSGADVFVPRRPVRPVFLYNILPALAASGTVAAARLGALRLLIGRTLDTPVVVAHRGIGRDVRLVSVAFVPGSLQHVLHGASVLGIDRFGLLKLRAQIFLPVIRLAELDGHGVAGGAAVRAVLLQDLPQGDSEGLRFLLVKDLAALRPVGLERGILRSGRRHVPLRVGLGFGHGLLVPCGFAFYPDSAVPACQALLTPFLSVSGDNALQAALS